MATGVVSWSQTAATNATADAAVNWAEGMAPSQVNDSARAVMASVAKWRDDMAGTLLSSGSNTAFTVVTNQVFPSLAALNGQTIVVRFAATNGAAPTLSVDGTGAKPINVDSATAVTSGSIRANSIQHLTYDNSLAAYIVHNGHSLVEPGRITSHGSTGTPPGWLVCDGTPVSRTTYADLFANIDTSFGSTDGATFRVPDLTNKFPAGAIVGEIGPVGTTGGESNHTLTLAEVPQGQITFNDATHTHFGDITTAGAGVSALHAAPGQTSGSAQTQTMSSVLSGASVSDHAGGGTHNNMPPYLCVNYLIKT